jgi:hypothetical protein
MKSRRSLRQPVVSMVALAVVAVALVLVLLRIGGLR